MKKYLLPITVLTLIFYIMLINSTIIIKNNNTEENNTQFQEFEQPNHIKLSKERDPILINGNNSFKPENGVSSGDGSREDPYIIEDLVINAKNNESCIFINNTNAYFKIINCTLVNSSPLPDNSTIKLNNVSNGYIFNNNISLAPVRLIDDDGDNGGIEDLSLLLFIIIIIISIISAILGLIILIMVRRKLRDKREKEELAKLPPVPK